MNAMLERDVPPIGRFCPSCLVHPWEKCRGSVSTKDGQRHPLHYTHAARRRGPVDKMPEPNRMMGPSLPPLQGATGEPR